MANIIDYLKWRGDLLIESVPFCDVDALILSQLVYTRMQDVVSPEFDDMTVNIGQMAAIALAEKSRLKQDEEDEELWQTIKDMPRFKDLQMCGYIERFDVETEKQFCAMTIKLSKEESVVVYRGTDLTIVGWKEDFNMSFADSVPAQQEGVAYLKAAAAALPNQQFYVCGHSKGGNLAVYSAAFCGEEVQRRIKEVRNFDGPGFSEENVVKTGMTQILKRTKTFLPQSSVVGMLLEHEEDFTVIHSRSIGLLQHDLYTWEILGPEFIIEEERTSSSQFIDTALKSWLKSMSKEKREAFVETVFSILDDCDAVTLKELFSGKNAVAMMKNLTQMEDEERTLILEGLDILKHSIKTTLPIKTKQKQRINVEA